jgi:hypothetical protein
MLKEATGTFSRKLAGAYNVKIRLFVTFREVLQVKQHDRK